MNPFQSYSHPIEFKVMALRECPVPPELSCCDNPLRAAEYFRTYVESSAHFNPECECLVVLLLNTRRRIKAHQLISIGLLDTVLLHPREVFRGAIVGCASAIVLLHNHPSGDPSPSDADVRATRDMVRAGEILKIEVLDHIIVGRTTHVSLRELGLIKN